MAGSKFLVAPLVVILAAVLAGYINVASIYRSVRVFGILRAEESTIAKEQLRAIRIADTPYCEDLHRHAASGLLFAACEGSEETRHAWFPPLTIFDNGSKALQTPGTITAIDPETMKAKRLQFEGFSGPFVTHGIDIIDDPKAELGKAIYIFAVNHRPNADKDPLAPKADSVIEVFHHTIGTNTVRHVRTVKHGLITTPNDILALSPTSFLVTNDHFYRDGIMRIIEDIYTAATWSNTIYAKFEVGKSKPDEAAQVKANVALTGLHNNNGLGPGRNPGEVVLVDAAGGMVHFGEIKTKDDEVLINVTDTFEAESTLDNPHYFVDPYANNTFDASGFILPGLSKGIHLAGNARLADGKDGVIVWHLRDRSPLAKGGKGKWEAKLLLQDNADFIRTASGSVLIPIDPAQSNGRRQAWLFVTGFMSKNVVAVKVGL
ncbi:hypothetical protein PWT90_02075 [Aphanocladium album]|nr:hypothetical protein PWT90_02075 [Aphanocladium album]